MFEDLCQLCKPMIIKYALLNLKPFYVDAERRIFSRFLLIVVFYTVDL